MTLIREQKIQSHNINFNYYTDMQFYTAKFRIVMYQTGAHYCSVLFIFFLKIYRLHLGHTKVVDTIILLTISISAHYAKFHDDKNALGTIGMVTK